MEATLAREQDADLHDAAHAIAKLLHNAAAPDVNAPHLLGFVIRAGKWSRAWLIVVESSTAEPEPTPCRSCGQTALRCSFACCAAGRRAIETCARCGVVADAIADIELPAFSVSPDGIAVVRWARNRPAGLATILLRSHDKRDNRSRQLRRQPASGSVAINLSQELSTMSGPVVITLIVIEDVDVIELSVPFWTAKATA
jgi:hypothetical protein